jgi:hypothetical protein
MAVGKSWQTGRPIQIRDSYFATPIRAGRR